MIERKVHIVNPLSYFLVPALARYKFDNHMYAEIGPQFALMHKAYIEFDSDIDGIEVKAQEDNRDMIKGLIWVLRQEQATDC